MLGSVKSLSSIPSAASAPSPRFLDVPLTQETVEDRPWKSPVIETRERTGTSGVYGVGLKVNHTKDFGVLAVTGLRDERDRNINSSVVVGDTLCFVNDRSVEKEGSAIIETTIFGDLGSMLKLTLRSCKTNSMYDLMVKRHVPIRATEYSQQWYAVKEEYAGGELLTDAKVIASLDAIRHCAIDDMGREVDFLAGIKKRGSSCGLALSAEKGQAGRRVEKIVQGSPAGIKGMQAGDLIVAVDGQTGHDNIASLLGGEQRIGSTCKVDIVRSGRKEQVELVRTQVAAMNRTAEMLSCIDELPEMQGEAASALQRKVLELERERQYEERVMAGRLNASNTVLLEEVAAVADSLAPPRPHVQDHSAEVERLRKAQAELEQALEVARTRAEELAAEGRRLEQALGGMVPAVELAHARDELAALRRQLAASVPQAQYDQMEVGLQGLVGQLRGEKRAADEALVQAEQVAAARGVECAELQRRLALMGEELAAVRGEHQALRGAQAELMARATYDKMEQSLQALLRDLRDDKRALEEAAAAAAARAGEAEAEAGELRRRLEGAEGDKAALRAAVAAAHQQLREAQAAADAAAAEAAGLRRKMEAAEEEVAGARARLQAAERARAEAEAGAETMERRAKTAEDAAAELQAEMERMRPELTQAKEDAERAGREGGAVRRQVERLEAAAAELRAQAVSSREKAAAAAVEAEMWREKAEPLVVQLEESQGELGAAEVRVRTLRAELAGAKEEAGGLRAQLKSAAAEAAAQAEAAARREEELRRAQAEAAEAAADAEAAGRRAREEAERAGALAEEKQALARQLAAAGEAAERLRGEVEAGARRVRASEDETMVVRAELAGVQGQLAEAEARAASLQTQLRAAEQRAGQLAAELAGALKRSAVLQREVDEARAESAGLREELRRARLDAAELERRLKRAEEEAGRAEARAEAARREAEAAGARGVKVEEEAEAERRAHGETRGRLAGAEQTARQLRAELEAALRAAADKEVVEGELAGLRRELAGAGLAEAEARAEVFGAMAGPPMLAARAVARVVRGAGALPGATLETAVEVLEAMADEGAPAGDVAELLRQMREGVPARTALEVQVVLKVLNQPAAWSGETLLHMREALDAQGVVRASQVVICPAPPEHHEAVRLRQAVRDLLAPEFDQKGGGFVARQPLTIRGRPGSTIYAYVRAEATQPTAERHDKACVSPMELVLEDSCVVTAVASLDGALGPAPDVSAPRVATFVRKRNVTREAAEGLARAVPLLREERVGVGMLIEKAHAGPADVVVKSITPGGEVDKDARIAVGDVLLEVDGRDLDGMDLNAVRELMLGPAATEVVMVLERRGAQRAAEGVVADNLYSVRLFRTKNDAVPSTFSPRSFVASGKNILDSGKNLLQGLQRSTAPAPRPTKSPSLLSQSQFSTVPRAAGQSPVTVSSSPVISLGKSPGVSSPGIYMASPGDGQAAGKNSDLLIAM